VKARLICKELWVWNFCTGLLLWFFNLFFFRLWGFGGFR